MIKTRETKQNKRVLSILLTFVLLLGAFFAPDVYADSGFTVVEIENVLYDSYLDNAYYTSGLGLTQAKYDSLCTALYNATSAHAASLSVSSYNITYNSTTSSVLSSLVYKNDPRIFNIQKFSLSISGSKVYSLNFTYSMTNSVYREKLSLCEAAAEEMTADIKNSSLTEAQKALIIHDRLAVLCEYDLTYNLEFSHDMCGPLIENVAVCEGYAQAYGFLLDKVGIKSYMISSDALNHAWNIVYIDGKKYHVDVTWDDPTYDITGRVKHNNFLLSSTGIYNAGSKGHKANDYDTSPYDTTYDNYFWQNSETAFQYMNGDIYYIEKSTGALKKWSGNTHTTILTISDKWYASGGGYWTGCHSKLSASKNYLYYSMPKGIYRYDTKLSTSTLVYSPDLSSYDTFSIFGFKADDTYFYLDVHNSPNFTASTKATYGIKYKYTEPTPTQILYGDANGDSEIDSSDAATLLKADAGLVSLSALRLIASDVNSDGEVDSSDATLIFKYDAGLITSFK